MDDLVVPFIFVPDGAPAPSEWLAAHPGAFRVRGSFRPRRREVAVDPDDVQSAPVAGVAPRDDGVRAGGTAAAPVGLTSTRAPFRRFRPSAPPATPGADGADPIGSYRRVKDGMEAQAISYASANAPVGSDGPPRSQQPGSSPTKTVIFIGGLLDELVSHIVERYEGVFAKANPGLNVHYFTFDQKAAAEAYIKRLGKGARVAIVGHSYGGDTAVQIVKDLPAGRIETLLTIDPVGHGGRGMLEAVGRRAKQWIDVDAVDKRHSIDNRIAGLGGKYDKAPKPYAKTFIESNNTHAEFESMMSRVEQSKGQTMVGLLFPVNEAGRDPP